MPVETKKREGQQLLLRFPDGSDLRERLEECAKASSRSLTGEIVHRLEMSLRDPRPAPSLHDDTEERVRSAIAAGLRALSDEDIQYLAGRVAAYLH
jgi:hypothetical protein